VTVSGVRSFLLLADGAGAMVPMIEPTFGILAVVAVRCICVADAELLCDKWAIRAYLQITLPS
jgi:hypothetical protein